MTTHETHTTHEPFKPTNWPFSNVNVELTDESIDECIAVHIHDDTHYLHVTTAIELFRALGTTLEAWANQSSVQHARDIGRMNEETYCDCKKAGVGSRGLVSDPPIR